jgi:glycosyltransferase involved in cell wall biosynthesis
VSTVGRLSPERGVGTLLQAWSRAVTDDLELVVVGDGPLRGGLEVAAPPGVRFVGTLPADDVRRLMLEARALLFPTEWHEPFGLVAAEAMAAGAPVVASDIGAVPEVVGDVGGWRVPPGDVARWAAAIETVLADDLAVDERGAAARQRFEERFSGPASLVGLERAYGDARRRERGGRAR